MKIRDEKQRIVYLSLFLFFTLIEVLIALFVRDAFIRPYVGDVLVTVVMCCFLRVCFPKGSPFLVLFVFLFAAAVEVGQYFDYASLLGLDGIRFFRILMGTTFSVADLICYAVGCSLFFIVENLILSHLCRARE